jgi:hypothetical protein
MGKVHYMSPRSRFFHSGYREGTMRARAIVLALTGLLLITSSFDSARGQTPPADNAVSIPIGKIITATGSVTIEHGSAVVVQANLPNGGQSRVGDPVYKGDVVSTGADSKLGIVFVDGTTFNISSNARMVLNEFVYDPKGTSNSTLISLTKGTFTFIAGKVAKTGDMKIDTPVATMGIRGTTPHVEIRDDGTVAFSTLMEDKKAIEKLVSPRRVRHAKVAPPDTSSVGASSSPPATSPSVAGTPSTQPTEKKADSSSKMKPDSSFDINVKICRGC